MNEDLQHLIDPYLHGELSKDELESFEESFFRDDDLFEQIETAEMRLLDRYVRNEMAPDEIERFENGYLTTPDREKKVAEARIFHREVAKIKPEGKGFLAGLFEMFSFKVSVLQFASVATIILICVGALWTLWILQTDPQPVAEGNVQGPAPPIGANSSPPPVVIPTPDNGQEQETPPPKSSSRETPEDDQPRSRDIMPPGGNPTYATPNAREIFITLTRSSSGSPTDYQRIELSEGIRSIGITIQLPESETSDSYDAVVRGISGQTIYSRGSLRPFGSERNRIGFRLEIGEELENGRYRVEVRGEEGAAMLTYGFEITGR